MMKIKLIALFLLLGIAVVNCNVKVAEDENFLLNLMKTDNFFDDYLQNMDTLELQIIYTQINRDSLNRPSFKTFYFNVDSARYFYPASTVKLPLTLLAIEKLNDLDIQGLDMNTPMFHDSVYVGQKSVAQDTTAPNGFPSIGHYAKKILVVSDNDAYNRLYEFLGQRYIYDAMREKGYHLRVLHRFDRPLPDDQNRHTEAVRFMQGSSVIFKQDGIYNADSIRPPERVLRGKGYTQNDTLILEPFEFTYKNFFPLTDQQRLLRSIIFPETIEDQHRFRLSKKDRLFILKYMSQYPTETISPPYAFDTTYYDAYCKFFMFGEDKTDIPANIRIFNKVGDAYGYMIDNAYVVDFDNDVEFMLSAVIHTNMNGIYNDGQYELESLGFPFMKAIGNLIYHYELQRSRKYAPDLREFRIQYDRPR